MIELELFLTFFKIGLFTIGGGQAMIPLIMKDIVAKGWLSQEILVDFIAISEATPGPFAVNIATYTGVETAGFLGALAATCGVILPSIIIITLIAKLFANLMKRSFVADTLVGVRSSVTGLLSAVFVILLLSTLFSINSVFDTSTFTVDYIGIGIFAVMLPLSFVKIKGKKLTPIMTIIICAIIGILCYGFIPV